MGLREFFLWQLEHETETSRAVIERVPEGRNHWKPHAGSMELGELAALVASMPGWVASMVNRRVLTLSNETSETLRATPRNTRAELCQLLASGLAKSRKALEETTEDHLVGMVRFRRDGLVVSEGPRYAMIADIALTQQAHHRGQLTVYLGMLEAEVATPHQFFYTVKESSSPGKGPVVESVRLHPNLSNFSTGSYEEVFSSGIRTNSP